MRSSRSFPLSNALVNYWTHVTRGADPTQIQYYKISPNNGRSIVLLTEFFGDWTFEVCGGEIQRGLDTAAVDAFLSARDLPTLTAIEERNAQLEEQDAINFIDDGIYGEA
jgi:hypothetical protein